MVRIGFGFRGGRIDPPPADLSQKLFFVLNFVNVNDESFRIGIRVGGKTEPADNVAQVQSHQVNFVFVPFIGEFHRAQGGFI